MFHGFLSFRTLQTLICSERVNPSFPSSLSYVLSHSLPLAHSGELGNNLVKFHKTVQCPQKLLLGIRRGVHCTADEVERRGRLSDVETSHPRTEDCATVIPNVIRFLSASLHLLVLLCSSCWFHIWPRVNNLFYYLFTLCCCLEWELSSLYCIFVLFVYGRMISAYQLWE